MAQEGFKRKLTAILSADVEGYSRLMGEDEEATVSKLTAYREVLKSLIQQHNGRVIDSPGDNLLAEFASVVDAVQCALAVQKEIKTCNEELSENRKMQFRIGINLGDVIEDREDIYGDGVNIAARLESLADPGGICISESVRTAVGNKLQVGFESMGEQQVKNIAEPVAVYRVMPRALQDDQDAASMPPDTELPDKPSIAVLPFTNMSGDPEQEYFSDGITEDIITELSRFSALFVIARHSSFVFKGQTTDLKEVGARLGVRYLVEGSVRKAGNRVRITAQLVDAMTPRRSTLLAKGRVRAPALPTDPARWIGDPVELGNKVVVT